MNNPSFDQMKAIMQNPQAFCQKFNLPPNVFQNPQAAEAYVRQCLNSGQLTQEQFNMIDSQLRQTLQNPQAMQQYHSIFG